MWQLKKEKNKPVYQQIVELILGYIDQGRLLPGEKIPSERKLAELLTVNRTTIVHALDELVSMGVIVRKRGSGTVINDGKWGVYRGSTIDWRHYLSKGNTIKTHEYNKKAHRILANRVEVLDVYSGDLPLGLVPELDLPTISWKEFLNEEKKQDSYGYFPLRQLIVERLNETNKLSLDVPNLMLTPGAQQALLLLVQVLLNNGDALAIEEPSSFYQLFIFQAAGIRVYGIPVDKEGMRVDVLEEKILKNRIKMVLVNPNYQNPTGTTMSLKRRKELISICRKYQLPIVEDDVFGELYFDEESRPPLLKKMDPENVIYIGSFSKILGATTKIGWLSGPVKVIEKVAKIRSDLDLNMSIFPQVLAYNALENKTYESQMSDLRLVLFEKMTDLTVRLDEKLKDEVSYYVPEGGCYLWLTFKNVKITTTDYDLLLTQGVIVTPGFVLGAGPQSLRINFSRLIPEQSVILVDVLTEMIRKKIASN
ncbi:aminotransferase-like domain-containing protein [Vagococcus fessus]|uniref:HTH gntR-type domain-containing protein n=1 Tax=Vagococcus fessus TaxID=120370 RepID=A0A430A7T1_9ENTE|nr:PLP-dependent aminotransferase family protein [Vagococcus fessus]RSU03155.1 hypothetical protein CBF31_05410 [Vagococcus fessus]